LSGSDPRSSSRLQTGQSEQYQIVQLRNALSAAGAPLTASELLTSHAAVIAQLVTGESQPLSQQACAEVLQLTLSYFPTDLVVVGWAAALVYDTPVGAAPAIQVIEYAKSQLLEFRYYDKLLSRVLQDGYDLLGVRRKVFGSWGIGRAARRLNAIRLDFRELTERVDHSMKFLGDMFYARVYRLAADRLGLTDYRRLVDAKLKSAGELYDFMVSEYHHGRAFLLEALVVAILIVDLLLLFWGRG
jgi:hypothetical protein